MKSAAVAVEFQMDRCLFLVPQTVFLPALHPLNQHSAMIMAVTLVAISMSLVPSTKHLQILVVTLSIGPITQDLVVFTHYQPVVIGQEGAVGLAVEHVEVPK
jgi:hypothetical protein